MDYGERDYSNRGIPEFLREDDRTADYPELAPYSYGSNTPIQAIDLDGLEASYVRAFTPDFKPKIIITFDVKVQNSTKMSAADVVSRSNAIKQQTEKSFSGFDKESNTIYETRVNLTFLKEGEKADPKKDYYIEFVDKVNVPKAKGTEVGAAILGDPNVNRIQVKGSRSEQSTARTGAHELGHTVGLEHPNEIGKQLKGPLKENNLMSQTRITKGTEINNEQRKEVVENIDDNK